MVSLSSLRQLTIIRKGPIGQRQTTIAGGTVQTDLLALRHAVAVKLRNDYRVLVREFWCGLMASHGRTWTGMQFGDVKSLISMPGFGEQMIHFDSQHFSTDFVDTTGVLYCSDTNGTLLPSYSALKEFDFNMLNTEESIKQNKAALYSRSVLLTDRRYFRSLPVKAGTLVLFRHPVPHAGVNNPSVSVPRTLLFTTIHETGKVPSGAQQYFYWHWLRDVYGFDSPEFLDALIDEEKAHQPLLREASHTEAMLRPMMETRKKERR